MKNIFWGCRHSRDPNAANFNPLMKWIITCIRDGVAGGGLVVRRPAPELMASLSFELSSLREFDRLYVALQVLRQHVAGDWRVRYEHLPPGNS